MAEKTYQFVSVFRVEGEFSNEHYEAIQGAISNGVDTAKNEGGLTPENDSETSVSYKGTYFDSVLMGNDPSQIKTEDGYFFYRLPCGGYADNKEGNEDMSWPNFSAVLESLHQSSIGYTISFN